MIKLAQIQEKLSASLHSKAAMWDFADWLARASWNMHKDSEQEAIDLVLSLNHLFADYDNELIDEDALLRKLHVIAAPSVVVVKSFSFGGQSAATVLAPISYLRVIWSPAAA